MDKILDHANTQNSSSQEKTYKILMLNIGNHIFGAIIDTIEDVIKRSPTTPIPLAPDHIIGLLNLRGYIVTEINIAKTLDIADDAQTTEKDGYSVVINHNNEMYSLVFDGIGDVIEVPKSSIEKLPDTVNPKWFTLSKGVYRSASQLVIILDFASVVDYLTPTQKVAYH